jgi:NO-binding membrane sensor protein with MHYT domain
MGWLGLSSAAVSIALWAAIMVGLSAMEFPALPDSATFSFQSLETFLSLLIAIPLAFAAYAVIIRSTKYVLSCCSPLSSSSSPPPPFLSLTLSIVDPL